MKYNKLVRDKIREIIKSRGGIPEYHLADDMEYWTKLIEKFREELIEFHRSRSEEELADIWEVMDAVVEELAKKTSLDLEKVKEEKNKKAKERGRFRRKIILEEA